MFRAVLFALIVGLSFEVSGLASMCGGPADAEECAGDECPPSCRCACCSLPKTIVSPFVVIVPAPQAAAPVWHAGAEAPVSTDPAEIFHVPKSLLA